MTENVSKTAERIVPKNFKSKEEYLIYLRHLFAYSYSRDQMQKENIVLEIGCGEGYGTHFISEKISKIIGLDIDNDTIKRASEEYQSEFCIFQKYDGIKIPFEDNVFDIVVSFQVVEHIKDDENFISEAYRVLKRGGLFILTTPNRIHRLKSDQKPWQKFHIREYSAMQLRELLCNVFINVEILGIRGKLPVQEIELKRVLQCRNIALRDPFNIRLLIPRSIRISIFKLIKREQKTNRNFLREYFMEDFFIIKENIEESIDLVGVCKK